MDPAGFLAFVVERRKEVDPAGFLAFVVERRKEVDALRAELPAALQRCVDPARFAMDAVSEVFLVDRRAVRSPIDLAWACVLILEAVVPALADPDPEIGAARPMVPQAARDRARGMAAEWKEAAERKGGVEGAKPPDGHAFLQQVATFAVAEKEDRELYKRIVLTFSWHRQMPRLALTLGLEDDMEDIIEELITKGQQLDAVNFAYEVAKSSGLALASDLSANDSTVDYQSGSHTTLGLCRRGTPNASFEHGLQRQQGPQALSATLHSDIMSRGVMEPRPRKELFPATPATGCRSRLVQDCLSCLVLLLFTFVFTFWLGEKGKCWSTWMCSGTMF